MSQSLQIGVLIALAVLAANLPFASQRLFLLGPVRQPKGLAWRLLELVLMYLLVGEWQVGGQHGQSNQHANLQGLRHGCADGNYRASMLLTA